MNDYLIKAGTFIGIIVVTILMAYLVRRFFARLIQRSTDEMHNDPTNYQFLKNASSGIIYLVGIGVAIYTMPSLRTLANSLLAGASILAIAVGLAAQSALGNIISGIFIVIFKPFRVTDRLKIRDLFGTVEDITLRHTVLRDLENKRIVIPNTLISDEIITNSDYIEDKICKFIDVRISYDSNIDLAKEIITSEILNHRLHVDPRTPKQVAEGAPEVVVRVVLLGEYSVNLRAWAWAKDLSDGFVLKCDLLESVKKRFDKEGVEIPYPHRTLVQKNSLVK